MLVQKNVNIFCGEKVMTSIRSSLLVAPEKVLFHPPLFCCYKSRISRYLGNGERYEQSDIIFGMCYLEGQVVVKHKFLSSSTVKIPEILKLKF